MGLRVGFILLTNDDFYEYIDFPEDIDFYECHCIDNVCASLVLKLIKDRYNTAICHTDKNESEKIKYFWKTILDYIENKPGVIITLDNYLI
jgi:hypothetical protein